MRTRFAIVITALLTLLPILAPPVFAQTPDGAFAQLAPGEQKIARSLFDAQRRNLPPGRRQTLDQLAAKRGSEGWGKVFKDMKSQGLVTQKNLGQVVRTEAGRPVTAASGAVTGANRVHDQSVGHAATASVRGHSDDVTRGSSSASTSAGSGHGRGR